MNSLTVSASSEDCNPITNDKASAETTPTPVRSPSASPYDIFTCARPVVVLEGRLEDSKAGESSLQELRLKVGAIRTCHGSVASKPTQHACRKEDQKARGNQGRVGTWGQGGDRAPGDDWTRGDAGTGKRAGVFAEEVGRIRIGQGVAGRGLSLGGLPQQPAGSARDESRRYVRRAGRRGCETGRVPHSSGSWLPM